MLANVGPGSYADRSDAPYKTAEGHDLLAPLRVATNFAVPAEGANPIGYAVFGADRVQGASSATSGSTGPNRSSATTRWTCDGGKRVLLPVHFANIDAKQRRVTVSALSAAQFADVPATREPDRVTLLEEDKISAYYGAGTLYATPARLEPLL